MVFSTPIIKTDYQTAELVKYVCNTFFATKISFLNEMKLISDKVGAKWEDIIEALVRDGRIGNSHMNVPGPDGKRGFGGSCFPKDVMALIKFAEQLEIDSHTLKGVWNTNLDVRPEKDWENLVGRAIVEEKNVISPGGGIGRHKGLKIPRRRLRAGSSPALGTKFFLMEF